MWRDGLMASGLVLAGLIACADKGAEDAAADTGGGADDTGWAGDSDDADTAEEEIAEATWFLLRGEVELLAGEPAALRLWVSGLPDDGEAICSEELSIEASLTLAEVPDPVVYHWWELQVGALEGDCVDHLTLPGTLRLGLGALHPQLVPGLERHELREVEDSMYGSYASFEAPWGDGLAGTTYAFGFAGTAQDMAGDAPAVGVAPMPDGSYEITGWYPFKLP